LILLYKIKKDSGNDFFKETNKNSKWYYLFWNDRTALSGVDFHFGAGSNEFLLEKLNIFNLSWECNGLYINS
jgi:hypothetical protein